MALLCPEALATISDPVLPSLESNLLREGQDFIWGWLSVNEQELSSLFQCFRDKPYKEIPEWIIFKTERDVGVNLVQPLHFIDEKCLVQRGW